MTTQQTYPQLPPRPTFRKVSSAEFIKISRGAAVRKAGMIESMLGKLGYSPTPPPPPPRPRFGLNAVSPGRAALGGTGLGILAGLGGIAAANPEKTMQVFDQASDAVARGAGDLTDALMRAGQRNPLTQALSNFEYGNIADKRMSDFEYGDIANKRMSDFEYGDIANKRMSDFEYGDIATERLNHMDAMNPSYGPSMSGGYSQGPPILPPSNPGMGQAF